MNLPSEILVIIFSFLQLEELCCLENVCKYWYSLLLSSNATNLYRTLNLQKRNANIPYEWLTKKLSAHRPKTLNLSGTSIINGSFTSILQKASDFVENLDISFHHLTFDNYLSLNFTVLSSITANDAKLKDSCLEIILNLPKLSYLNINYNSSLTGKPFAYTDKQLLALWFEGCEHIEYSHILSYTSKHGIYLRELGIDGEYYSCEEVCTLLSLSPNLKKFAIEYANEMDHRIGEYLVKDEWEHIKARRAIGVPQICFSNIFNMELPNLVYLNLAECSSVDDLICILISHNCTRLLSFTLTWCSNVSDVGIKKIVTNCCCLNLLDLTGLKEITDISFPMENLETYSNLHTLILEKCNKITDNHLWHLSTVYPKLRIKNYYGEFKEGWTGAIQF